jgi:hypothetical protein
MEQLAALPCFLAGAFAITPALGAAPAGQPAPAFAVTDLAGKPVTTATTTPYGCTVKYK